METVKALIRSFIHGGFGAVIGTAFATAFDWKVWIFAVAGYILGWLLLSKSFWEGIKEGKEELAEEDRKREEDERKKEEERSRKEGRV